MSAKMTSSLLLCGLLLLALTTKSPAQGQGDGGESEMSNKDFRLIEKPPDIRHYCGRHEDTVGPDRFQTGILDRRYKDISKVPVEWQSDRHNHEAVSLGMCNTLGETTTRGQLRRFAR
jgi:hypothetical protein